MSTLNIGIKQSSNENRKNKILKNVLLITYQYPPEVGGAGSVARDIARLIQHECNLTLVTLDKGHLIEETFPIIQADTAWPFRFLGFWKTLRELNLDQFDDIIVNDTGASLVAARYFPAHIKAKCWVYLHGSEPENIYIKPEPIFRLLGFKKKYTQLLEHCKHIIAVSDYMKHKFVSMTQLSHLTEKIVVITNGIDESMFSPLKVDLREKYNVKTDTRILLSVSRLTTKKGYVRKLHLFKKLCEKQPLFWIVIGNGPFVDEFKSHVERHNLQSSVLILQGLERKQLVDYYSGADLFWLLSEYDESFGLVYLEANFCGCAVVGNRKGGVPYLINEGVNGFTVSESDDQEALTKMIQALTPNTFNSEKIIQSVKNYSIQKTKSSLLDLLKQ
ncbi:glycosyltransferase family 4 protein [Aliiglaciecola sp. LCG003]|uniref:glycosyltransferase family 4 protein n=1 Tax=Aliiglaciecola sp. LCG003 TaxID=3053655 RepID=UPI0025747084|nr:glycosyltransferase family 4 protein [Aliiglaciecola sp. LCG003]WJG10461.1 glycosyltransferase family 4 protein [Aliiglaciecola sp. LCG003]